MVDSRERNDVVEHQLTQRRGDLGELLLCHAQVPVAPAARPGLANRTRQLLEKESRPFDASAGRARGHTRGKADLEGDGSLAHLPGLIAGLGFDTSPVACRGRGAGQVADLALHLLLDMRVHPASGWPAHRSHGDGLQRLHPGGLCHHLAQIGDAVVGIQAGDVDALEH